MLKVCMVVDAEDFLSFKQGNPSWNSWQKFKGRINSLIKYIRYDKKGFERIYNLVTRERFPTSFMLVGSLFKPVQGSPGFIDWGYHTLNHKPLTLISDSELKEEVKNIHKATSFSAPMWMIEDAKNPGRVFKELKKQGYKITIYRGQSKGISNIHESRISKPIIKHGMTCVYTTDWFHSETRKRIGKIIREIASNAERDAVYCITTHDFSNKSLKNFEFLIKKLKEMESKGMIKIKNLAQIAAEYNKGDKK